MFSAGQCELHNHVYYLKNVQFVLKEAQNHWKWGTMGLRETKYRREHVISVRLQPQLAKSNGRVMWTYVLWVKKSGKN